MVDISIQLKKMTDQEINVFLLPGNHDYYNATSPYKELISQNSKLKVFTTGSIETFNIGGLDLNVYGIAHTKQFEDNSNLIKLIDECKKNSQAKQNIALVHGGVKLDEKIPKDNPFDYMAYGDWHGFLQIDTRACFCGSPEILAIDQKNSGNIVYVELNGKEIKTEKIRVSEIDYKEIEIDLHKILFKLDENSDIHAEIYKIIEGNKSADRILNVTIKGDLPPKKVFDVDFLEEQFKDSFYLLKINNQSKIKLDPNEIEKYPEEMVIGRFIRDIRKDIGETEDDSRKDLLNEILEEGIKRLMK